MTYSDLYKSSVEKLSKNGISEAAVDVRLLFDLLINKDRNFILVHGDDVVSDDEVNIISDAVNKRCQHIPLQHITGVADFMGLTFKVNENVLIPRFDTECLVEEVLKEVCDGAKVLDVCTGSGCIILSLMSYRNDIEATAVDISYEALEVAKENAKMLSKDVTFIQSDLFESVVDTDFEYILSNPPYIRTDDISSLMEEVKDHDPMLALDGGTDGLDFYRRLSKDSIDHLKIGGKVFFEIGNDQGKDVSDILKNDGYRGIEVIKDYAGNDRIVIGTRPL